MTDTTFTNATDYGPDDYINSAVNVTGMTVADVTNVRLEIDWNPNGSDCTAYQEPNEHVASL